ncbi:hypothetical protein D3C81_1195630 [compost metagenome]
MRIGTQRPLFGSSDTDELISRLPRREFVEQQRVIDDTLQRITRRPTHGLLQLQRLKLRQPGAKLEQETPPSAFIALYRGRQQNAGEMVNPLL